MAGLFGCWTVLRIGRTLVVLLSILQLMACGTLSRFPIDDDNSEAQRLARSGDLHAEVNALALPLIDKKTPGMVVGVLSADGSKRFFSYGVADKTTAAKPDANTLFAIGSLSKGFLAEIAAQLVQENRLAWDETIVSLLPPDTALSEDAKKITLLQLATHTAGLPRQPMTPQTLTYFMQYLFSGESFYKHFDRNYIVNYLKDFEAPATVTPQYSNIGYGLLSYIVEQRSGKKIDWLLHEKLTQPLGLRATGYAPEALPGYAVRARGYAGDQPKFIRRGQPVPDWQFTDIMRGAAALYSSADDLLTYASAHLHRTDDCVIDAAFQDSLKVRFDRQNEAAAVAWIVDNIRDRKITYQIGLVAGYTSYIGLDVENKFAVVVLQNSFNWTSIGHQLLLRLGNAEVLAHQVNAPAVNPVSTPYNLEP